MVRVMVMVKIKVGPYLPGGYFWCTSFVSKKNILKSIGGKSNDENITESNDGILSYHGSENEGTCFFG